MDMHVETYSRLSVYWDVTPLTLMSTPPYVSSALRTSNFTNIIYQLFYLIIPFTLVNVIFSNCLLYYVTLSYIHRTKDWIVSWFRRLVTDLPLQTPDFKPRPVLVGFAIERVVLT